MAVHATADDRLHNHPEQHGVEERVRSRHESVEHRQRRIGDDVTEDGELTRHDHSKDRERGDVDQTVYVDRAHAAAADDEAAQPDGQRYVRPNPQDVGRRRREGCTIEHAEQVVHAVADGRERQCQGNA